MTATTISLDRLHDFVRATMRKRELEAELNNVKADIAAAEALLVQDFMGAAVPKITLDFDGERVTVYTSNDVWAYPDESRGKTRENVMAALEETGNGDMIREDYSTQTLSALVREIRKDPQGSIPPALMAVLRITEKPRVRVRKG